MEDQPTKASRWANSQKDFANICKTYFTRYMSLMKEKTSSKQVLGELEMQFIKIHQDSQLK